MSIPRWLQIKGSGPNSGSPASTEPESSSPRTSSPTRHLYSPQPSPRGHGTVASPTSYSGTSVSSSYSTLPALNCNRRYAVTATIQQSLFGVVKLAFDRKLKVQVAVKISRKKMALQQQSRSGLEILENVSREAALMRYLEERRLGDRSHLPSETLRAFAPQDAVMSEYVLVNQKQTKKSSRAIQHVNAKKEEQLNKAALHAVRLTSAVEKPSVGSGYREGENHIIGFVEELEDDDFQYLINSFVPGGDLYSTLQMLPQRRFPESNGRVMFRQMVLGIMYLHEHGVAHLDMSLENVCLDSNDTIRIIDFGVAAIHPLKSKITSAAQYFSFPSSVMLLSTQTQNQSHESSNRSFICKAVQEMDAKPGKIRYMSPELLRGEQWDAFANDMFILYTLLTGHQPFLQAADTDGWFHAISSGHSLTAQMRELPNARVYNHLSNPVLDLLNSILEPEGSRATCEQILLHPWMQQVL